jgi:hypothetical protein
VLAGLVIIDPTDYTETQENRRLPLLDIGIDDYSIDIFISKWERKAMENKLNETRPISVQEEGQVLADMRNTDFKEISDSELPNIPVHILTGGRYDMPPRFRSTELLFSSLLSV